MGSLLLTSAAHECAHTLTDPALPCPEDHAQGVSLAMRWRQEHTNMDHGRAGPGPRIALGSVCVRIACSKVL